MTARRVLLTVGTLVLALCGLACAGCGEEGYVLVVGDGPPDGQVKHKFGGQPEGVPAAGLPKCRTCGKPLQLLFQIDLSDPVLQGRFGNLPYLWVVTCLTCVNESDLSYRVAEDGQAIEVLQQDVEEKSDVDVPDLHERQVTLMPRRGAFGADDVKKHQVGGDACWLQSEQVCLCPVCGDEMVFVAQVDSDNDLGLTFGSGGMLYVELCRKDGVLTLLRQEP
jgi:hypothetical protein